jgi:isoquinoline 1-oxidoreductase alpha subunit
VIRRSALEGHAPAGQHAAMQIHINGQAQVLDAADADLPLLWLLREQLGLTGSKFGCGAGLCGACTVQVDGQAMRSCLLPCGTLAGRSVKTIEGLRLPHELALQQAWLKHQVPQCGYCQSGMLMAASSLLAANPRPTPADIDAAISNLCRCGTYPRVKAAILEVAGVAS